MISGGGEATRRQSATYALNFKADDGNLDFDNRNLNANDNYSGGLLLLGKCLHLSRNPDLVGGFF